MSTIVFTFNSALLTSCSSCHLLRAPLARRTLSRRVPSLLWAATYARCSPRFGGSEARAHVADSPTTGTPMLLNAAARRYAALASAKAVSAEQYCKGSCSSSCNSVRCSGLRPQHANYDTCCLGFKKWQPRGSNQSSQEWVYASARSRNRLQPNHMWSYCNDQGHFNSSILPLNSSGKQTTRTVA